MPVSYYLIDRTLMLAPVLMGHVGRWYLKGQTSRKTRGLSIESHSGAQQDIDMLFSQST
jgi:hypothetical protein